MIGSLALAPDLVSPWVAVPLAMALMFLVAGHVLAVQRTPMPASRRRIRTASGLLMLVVAPLLAHAISTGPGTDQPRPMAVLWLFILSMLGMVVALALLDLVNTLRLARHGRAGARGRVRGRFSRGRA
ncbi:MAG: hypothetical protein ACKVS8_13120 [Phycisphaerales bacterium]